MNVSNKLRYLSRLRALIGTWPTLLFVGTYIRHKFFSPRASTLKAIPVGPYTFYFLYIDDFVGLFTEIFFKETYYLESTEKALFLVDCGANIGLSLLYFKLRAPHAQVTCFEPNPAARAVLEKNIGANHWEKDVTVFPFALGKEKGTTNLYVSDTIATGSDASVANYRTEKGRTPTSYPVEVTVLSEYLGVTVDLLKIDIEGPELDVLEEVFASGKLASVKSIQLEYHYIPKFFSRPLSDVLVLLQKAGFQTFVKSIAQPHNIIGRDTAHACMLFAWRVPEPYSHTA